MPVHPVPAGAVPAALAALSVLALVGCSGGSADAGARGGPEQPADRKPPTVQANRPALPAELPGLGPETAAEVPEDSRQVLIATGEGKDSAESTVVLHERTDEGWRAGEEWPAHNGHRGWTDDHRAGDLRTPIGVFTLSDAGGLLPDPGSRLPYDRSDAFTIDGTGFEGEPLAGSFDYVVAIDYNRTPGVTPLDWTRPEGADKGGGIWLHVDHDGPTQGCVSLAEPVMREVVRTLDPERDPVIVMGDRESLAR